MTGSSSPRGQQAGGSEPRKDRAAWGRGAGPTGAARPPVSPEGGSPRAGPLSLHQRSWEEASVLLRGSCRCWEECRAKEDTAGPRFLHRELLPPAARLPGGAGSDPPTQLALQGPGRPLPRERAALDMAGGP